MTETQGKTKDKAQNRFLVLLNEAEGGSTLADLNRETLNLINQVQMQGKAGSITLTISLEPQHNSPQLKMQPKIKVTLPAVEREVTILYTDGEGHLSRRDPRQPPLAGLVRPFAGPEED